MSRRAWGAGQSRGVPVGYDTWYDWALVWRYWHRQAEGLRPPYLLEQAALLRLGAAAGLTAEELADRLGVAERTIVRWRARLAA